METYTIGQAKNEIKASIAVYLQKDTDGKYRMREVNRLPFYLQGPPGVGKTEMAQQIAQELGIGFVSLSITHHTRNTILGLPVIGTIAGEHGDGGDTGAEVRYTEYTMSEMVAMVEKKVKEGYGEGILLVDEFACMAESLVAPMLAFLQTKNIGNYHLPEGWVLILCSNPTAYNKTARSFDAAVMDRVRLMEITFDAAEFVAYGEKKGFHSCVTEYLKLFPGDAYVCMTTEAGEKVIVTTRGWENLSWCLSGYETQDQMPTPKLIRQFLKSDDVTQRFFQYYLAHRTEFGMDKLDEVLAGKNFSRHIDGMKGKPYAARFQVMQFLGNVLMKNCEEIGAKTDLIFYLETVCGKIDGTNEEVAAMIIRNRLAGQEIGGNETRRELDDAESAAWMEILHIMRTEVAQTELSQGKTVLAEAAGRYVERMRKSLIRQEEKISDMVGNACGFLAQIEGEDNLMDPFINLLNQSKGLLDVMTAVKNPVYLQYNRRAYGMDRFLRRKAEGE